MTMLLPIIPKKVPHFFAARLFLMALRYLFGPVTDDYADEHLSVLRASGACRTFAADGQPEVTLTDRHSWEDVLAQLPADWRPDFVALYLPYTTIPNSLWEATVPLVGLAADWNLLWHSYRPWLPLCECVLTDP